MSSQPQPTVTHYLSPLERCPTEVLERIVLSAAEERLPGPPPSLLPLLTTSKTLNFSLSPNNNNGLYHELFVLKFDTDATSRRLNERWLTSKSLSAELRLRFGALNRIRRCNIDNSMVKHDLWIAFIILLEHDQKNARQLKEWAKAHYFALRLVQRWKAGGYDPEFGESVVGLACRIIWELVCEAELVEPLRRELGILMLSPVVHGYKFSSFYASEEFFVITGQPEELEERVRGRPPASMEVQYYGRTIRIAAPPLAPACLSVYMLTMHPDSPRYTPGYMKGYIPGRTFSERLDDEWYRLIMCHGVDPVQDALSGKRFTPSSLIGLWNGIVMVPNMSSFETFISPNGGQIPLNLHCYGLEMRLREHHCLGGDQHTIPAPGPDGIADDPLCAWIPQGATFKESNDILEVYDPIEGHRAMYETYRTNAEHPYVSQYDPEEDNPSSDESDSTEEELQQAGEETINNDRPSIPDEVQGLVNDPSYVYDDDWEETVEHIDSGISDIIVTGTMKSGDHEHPLRGRIRPWDGLIILLRLQAFPDESPDLDWVFRGYVHGERHIFGRWKKTSTPPGEVGWECGFMFTKSG